MRKFIRLFPIPAIVFCFIQSQRAQAEPTTRPGEKYLRLIDNGKDGGRLETSAVTFKNKDGVKVTLISAVHIGEKAYFKGLDDSFHQYDAVLYELVKPKEAGVPQPGVHSENPIAKIQLMMKNVLNLDFQLDDIDYSAKNFVHADMDAETFEKLQKDRHETFNDMIMKAIQNAFNPPEDGKAGPQQNVGDLVDEAISALTRPDMERQIKLILARQMQDIEASAAGFASPDGTSVIVTERNKKCLSVLKDTIESGKKNIAIYYGAAHMIDMSDHLTKDMGFTQVGDPVYRMAWDMTIRPDAPSGAERLLREMMKSLSDN